MTFIAASIASRLGLKRKMLLGIAEERGGRRGAGNAIANTGVGGDRGAWSRWPAPSGDAGAARVRRGARRRRQRYGRERDRQGVGTADVVVTSLTRVPPGTSGAMSLEGTAAGVAGALGTAALAAVALGLAPLALARRDRRRRDGRRAARELARRDARSAGYPEQRHAELHQHGGRGARVAIARSRRWHVTMNRPRALRLLEFSRPFTLVAPALGFVSGAVTAYGAAPREAWHAGSDRLSR